MELLFNTTKRYGIKSTETSNFVVSYFSQIISVQRMASCFYFWSVFFNVNSDLGNEPGNSGLGNELKIYNSMYILPEISQISKITNNNLINSIVSKSNLRSPRLDRGFS